MLSRTVDYALRAMMDLAGSPVDAARTSLEIARHTRVPKQYLSKVLRDLTRARLITSRRGPNGGFRLACAPSAISMLDVIDAVDPLRRIERCPLGNAAHLKLCPLHRRLDEAIDLLRRTYATTTLEEVLTTSVGVGECVGVRSAARAGA